MQETWKSIALAEHLKELTLDKIEPHQPSAQTIRHAESLHLRPGTWAQLTGRIYVYCATEIGLLYFQTRADMPRVRIV